MTSLCTVDNIVGTDDGMDVKRFFKIVPKTKVALLELAESLRKK